MAIGSFSMRDALSPFAGQLAENFRELMVPLTRIQDAVELQLEEQRETNRLLTTLVDRLSPPTAAKLPVSKSPSRGRSVTS